MDAVTNLQGTILFLFFSPYEVKGNGEQNNAPREDKLLVLRFCCTEEKAVRTPYRQCQQETFPKQDLEVLESF